MAKEKRRRVITQMEVIKVNDLLKLHLAKVPGTDLWEYIHMYSDDKIAVEVDPTLPTASVSNMRLALYGKLRSAIPNQSQIEDIITQLQNVVNSFTELSIKHSKLCETLSLNKVADVRHLSMGKTEGK